MKAYIRREYIAGDTIEVEKLHTSKYGGKRKREKWGKPTPESVKKYNELLAMDRLRRKVNANFGYNDLHIVLTYQKGIRPSPKESADILEKALDKARRAYKKEGLKLKYIVVTGFGKRQDIDPAEETEPIEPLNDAIKHNEIAIHHHLVVNYIDIRIWAKIWEKYGRVKFVPLDSDGDYTQLANYLFRHMKDKFREEESPCRKRWSCSRNLKEPVVSETVVKADSWREEPKPKEGYYIIRDSIRSGVSEVTGYPYQFYRMVKIKGHAWNRPRPERADTEKKKGKKKRKGAGQVGV